MIIPPLTWIFCPVIHELRSDSRKQTQFATSSGWPSRASGSSETRLRDSSGVTSDQYSGVSIAPGEAQLTPISWPPSSRAKGFTVEITPPLDAVECAERARPG